MARLVDGYDRVPGWLGAPVARSVRLRHVVTAVDWCPGHVRVTARHPDGLVEIDARAAIVTLPISLLQEGVLGRGAVRFAPALPSAVREAASRVTMGHVARICLLFEKPLAELVGERKGRMLTRTSFIHARGVDVPVWWTSYPIRSGLMVGWAGGPVATALLAEPARVADRARVALASALGIDRRTIARHLVGTFTHDWRHDPFSRGAYSYPLVGGADAARTLSRSIRGTLFLAGEATDAEGRTATVHGAIATGYRAAAQASRSLSRG
jgi:monoamine oxidase